MTQGWFVARKGWRFVVRRAQMPPTPEEQEVLDREFWDAVKNVKKPMSLPSTQPVKPGSKIERVLFNLDQTDPILEDVAVAESVSACYLSLGYIPEWALAPRGKK